MTNHYFICIFRVMVEIKLFLSLDIVFYQEYDSWKKMKIDKTKLSMIANGQQMAETLESRST